MKAMLALALMVLMMVAVEVVDAESEKCICEKRQPYYTSCGWWGWSRCLKHRNVCSFSPCEYRESFRSLCSEKCGPGTQAVTKTGYCKDSTKGSCATRTITQTVHCNNRPCPIDGGWSVYMEDSRSECSPSCGAGFETLISKRTCTNPSPRYRGADCVGSASKTEHHPCNLRPCPIHGGWSDWEEWTPFPDEPYCSVFCGGGTQNRTTVRYCTNPKPMYRGLDCKGNSTKDKTFDCGNIDCGNKCNNTYFAHETDSHYFYHCDEGDANANVSRRGLLKMCPDGTEWDSTITNCGHEDVPTDAANTAASCEGDTLAAVSGNCSQFSQCMNGEMVPRPCPRGLHFNTATKACDWPNNANCEG